MPGPVLNLDDLRPADVTIRFHGVNYKVPGDVPLMTLIEATNLHEQLESAATMKEQADTFRSMYRLVMELFKARNDKVPDLALSATEVGYIVGFIASGGDMAALPDAIVGALSPGTDDEEEAGGKRPPTRKKPAAAGRRSPRAKP